MTTGARTKRTRGASDAESRMVAAIVEQLLQRLGKHGAAPAAARASAAPFYSMSEVVAMKMCTRQHIYRLIERGEFPKPVKVAAHRIGFKREEVDMHFAALPRALGGESRAA